MRRSSHPAGLLHASSCSPDLQVPPCFIPFCLPCPVFSPLTSSPPPAVLSPSCGVLSKLRKMEPGAAAPRYGQLLECACSWGQASDVVELVTDWLAEVLPKQGVSVAERQPGLGPPGLRLNAVVLL